MSASGAENQLKSIKPCSFGYHCSFIGIDYIHYAKSDQESERHLQSQRPVNYRCAVIAPGVSTVVYDLVICFVKTCI